MNPSNKYDHSHARQALDFALDGELDDAQKSKLEQHLAECDQCRIYAQEMTNVDRQLTQSLQKRWPQDNLNDSKIASSLAKLQPRTKRSQWKSNFLHSMRNLAWVALVIMLIVGLVWTLKTLAPIPAQGPAGLNTPTGIIHVVQPTVIPKTPPQSAPTAVLPAPTAKPAFSNPVDLLPNVQFIFAHAFPNAPALVTLYRQNLSAAVTKESALEVAKLWGINGFAYPSPSEGSGDVIFDVSDGTHSMRFLNFPDQFIYQVDFASPDYVSALMDNGSLPSFDQQVAIATSFLQPLNILDQPYKTAPLETERGTVAFIPLLDGYQVIQEIGVDRGNIGWIDVKVSSAGQVTQVQYSHHDFQSVGDYPILTAQEAWNRFSDDVTLQHSRYAILSPQQPDTYQSWSPTYQPGQQADLYGWVNAYIPDDTNSQELVMINNLEIKGDTASLSPANRYAVKFVHAWGQIEPNESGGIALILAGWETSSLSDQYITGTLQTKDGQVQLVTPDRSYSIIDPPSSLSDGTQVDVQGVVLEGNPPGINWTYIDTGEIPITYGASNSCGGGGAGGNSFPDANFGGGSFALVNIDQNTPTATQIVAPYQPGDEISTASGTVYVTRHIYLGGKTSLEVTFSPDQSTAMDVNWGYSLIGDNLSGIDQYQNLPVRIWGKVDHLDKNIVYINVDRFEPLYPGVQIHALDGTEKIVSLNDKNVILFTSSVGNSYVLKSSLDYGAEGNTIGPLGSVIEIEGYLIPDQTLDGYQVLRDLGGSTQLDGVVDSAQVSIVDQSQEASSNPGAVLKGKVTIDTIELAYDSTNLDRCQATAAQDPNMKPWLYVQPMWVFTGHFDDGRRFIVQEQALPDQFLK